MLYIKNYSQVIIYNDEGKILFKTERPNDAFKALSEGFININVRNARKINFNKKDCFQVKTNKDTFFTNGYDLYIHESFIEVLKVEEVKHFESHGQTCFKDVYTLKVNCLDGLELQVESDYYTRYEKTPEREYREKLAKVISECMYHNLTITHYDVEALLEKLDITIKEVN